VRIATWNVNSVSARAPRLLEWLGQTGPDVACLQETKCDDDAFPTDAVGGLGYEVAAFGQGRWNGVAILSRVGLAEVVNGLEGGPVFDQPEARAVAATCGGLRVWSIYVPHGREPGHRHYTYKLEWLAALRETLSREVTGGRPLAVCGDFNVAPSDADVWDPAAFAESTHVTPAEREALTGLRALGLSDVVPRALKHDVAFTWWDYRAGMFHKNCGMRIDLVYATETVAAAVTDAYVDREARKGKAPSDHAPVVVDIDDGQISQATVRSEPAPRVVATSLAASTVRPAAPSLGRHVADRRLDDYTAKRDFTRTPEPPAPGAEPDRFVIHHHHASRLHYDLRLEHDGVLACWAVPKGLPTAAGETRLAVRTEDHPLAYADFEGTIPEGNYGAGEMAIFDQGTYEAFEWGDDKITFRLAGRRHTGEYHMVNTARGWLVMLAKASAPSLSPPQPPFSPMQAKEGHLVVDDPGWRFEPAIHGVRTLAYVTATATRLVSATGQDHTATWPELATLATHVEAVSAVIDGVIVACDPAGRPSPQLLGQRRTLTAPADIERARAETPVKLFAFDLVWLDGTDLSAEPLEQRRSLLERTVTVGDPIGLTYYRDGDGARLLEASRGLGFDGVVAKRLGSPYLPGTGSDHWTQTTVGTGPLLVVDAPSLLYRAFFALPKTITGPDGHAVNALLGAANLILAAVAAHRPRAVEVCFGAEAATYRVEAYPPYHAKRPVMPPELETQWSDAPGFFGAFGWQVNNHDTLEADDLLGSLAAVETEAGGQTLLFTGDRDMFQCVNEHVAVLYPRSGKEGPELVDVDGVRRRYGIEPAQVPDFIALRGDPSDGLPGASGIGEKTAAELLGAHGTLEGVIAAVGNKTTKVAAAVRADAELLATFADVARLRRIDLPRPTDRATDFAAGAAAATARGMNRLAESLATTPSPPPDHHHTRRDAPVAADRPPHQDGHPARMPERIVPMLASAGAPPADSDRWAYELKWDGVRAVAYIGPGFLRMQSRNLNDITGRYPELTGLPAALAPHDVVLDGEVVCFDAHGQPSFAALQHRMHIASAALAAQLAQKSPVTYVIFDLLFCDGHSLMAEPYATRREALADLDLTGEHWQAPDHVVGRGAELRAAAAERHLEGIVAKRLDSPYEPGRRSGAWVKIKNVGGQELVIGGWTPGEGHRQHRIGALLVGVHEAGALHYAGRVGTGFSERELDRLGALLGPLQRQGSPFTPDGPILPRGAVFVTPELVCEVTFTEWTPGGQLRHPSYKGLRDDKPAAQVVREDSGQPPAAHVAPETHAPETARTGPETGPGGLIVTEETAKKAHTRVDGHELALSNLGKILYPSTGFTKRDVVNYYAAIAPVMLPHLAGRALTVKRYPDGVEGKAFYEKQTPAHRPEWVRTVPVPSERRTTIDYTLADDLATLVWLANLAALELHTPLAHAATAERPTTLVFDLDPGPPATIVECCHVGLVLHGLFAQLGLESFPKTSGSKGLQVYVPLNNDDVTFAHTKPFAQQVAETLERAEPDRIVSRQTKALRPGKVLIDWSQNDQHKTTVCVYSLRARERPTASTPVDWGDVRAALDAGDPDQLAFDANQVLDRVAKHGDLMAPLLTLSQQLPRRALT